MTAGLAADPDLRHMLEPGNAEDLLIVTVADADAGNALSLPFRNATVVGPDDAGRCVIDGHYDMAVIDPGRQSSGWLAAVARRVAASLRPGSRVLVVLHPGRQVAANAPPTPLDGLAWQGLGQLNGLPCVVLRAGGDRDRAHDPAVLLCVARLAVGLAGTPDRDTDPPSGGGMASAAPGSDATNTPGGASVASLAAALRAQIDQRRESEHALMFHLATLVRQLDRERRPASITASLRAIALRVPPLRPVLRVLRLMRRGSWRATR